MKVVDWSLLSFDFLLPNSLLRRAHSMNDLNVQVCSLAPSDVNLQRLGRQPFSYLPTYNNSRNSLGAESDDLTRYKDVALWIACKRMENMYKNNTQANMQSSPRPEAWYKKSVATHENRLGEIDY